MLGPKVRSKAPVNSGPSFGMNCFSKANYARARDNEHNNWGNFLSVRGDLKVLGDERSPVACAPAEILVSIWQQGRCSERRFLSRQVWCEISELSVFLAGGMRGPIVPHDQTEQLGARLQSGGADVSM